MAINLLSLARSSASGLHNSGRGGGKSYSPGSKYGNKIAGTNIKQGAGLKDLAKKGRTFSGVKDSKIRKVAGKPSHVNAMEAKAIDKLGPLGEAWVQKIGSGTINPKTGLKEYGFLKGAVSWVGDRLGLSAITDPIEDAIGWVDDRLDITEHAHELGEWGADRLGLDLDTSWQPATGNWGIFGQTEGAKEEDRASAINAAKKRGFDEFQQAFEDKNIAGMFTETTDDDSPELSQYDNLGDFLKAESGFDNPAGTLSDLDVSKYWDEFDTRGSDEINATLDRSMEKINIQGRKIKTQGEDKNVNTGNQISTNLFGTLTDTASADSTKNFANSGNFAQDFKKKQLLDAAHSEFNQGKTEQDLQIEELDVNKRQVIADAETDLADQQDEYNQDFWANALRYKDAVTS